MQRSLPGTVAPIGAKDIRELIAALGPVAAYGLRTIRLRTECRFFVDGIVFAEYVVPGEIRLYMAPAPPWRLAFVPSPEDLAAFIRHGARLTVDDRLQQTTVAWEPDGLKSFYLYEVLAHEIGHHLLQYHKGKRGVDLCRRKDHELWAGLYSRRVDRIVRPRHGG